MGSRRWSIGSVAGLLLSGCASTAELTGAGPGLAAGCEEVERSVVGLDEAPAGLDATAAEWLARAEGEWSGELGRRRVTTAVGLAEGPIEVVRAEPADSCPPRLRIPLVQELVLDGAAPVLAEGVWDSADGSLSLVTTVPLLEVDGLSPRELVPAEWDTVDLQLRLQGGGDDRGGDGVATLAAQWWATRAVDAATSAVATGSTTTNVTVSGLAEPVFTVVVDRDGD